MLKISSNTITKVYMGDTEISQIYLGIKTLLSIIAVADSSFQVLQVFNNNVLTTAVQPDGKVLVGGFFTTFNSATQNYLIRLNTDGTKDTSFNIGTGFNDGVRCLAIQPDGKIVVGGSFTTFNGANQNRLIRLNTNGTKDTSFNIGTGFNGTVNSIDIGFNSKILAGGSFTTFNGATQNRLIRLNTNGTKDTGFNIGTGFNDTVQCVKSTERIVLPSTVEEIVYAAGSFTSFANTTTNQIVSIYENGVKNTAFNTGTGFLGSPSPVIYSISFKEPEFAGGGGYLFAGGEFDTYRGNPANSLIKLNADGTKDVSFDITKEISPGVDVGGTDGGRIEFVLYYKNKLYVAGEFFQYEGISQNCFVRVNMDGKLDTGFNTVITPFEYPFYQNNDFFTSVRSISIYSINKLILGGNFDQFQTQTHNKVLLVNI